MSLDKNRKIHIVDTTLRDGSHAVSHSYTVDQVTAAGQSAVPSIAPPP